MKIAVITHYSYSNNYGQRLQNIALVQYLKNIYKTDNIYTFVYAMGYKKRIVPVKNSVVESKFLKPISINLDDPKTFTGFDLYIIGSDQVFAIDNKWMGSHVKDFLCGRTLAKCGEKHFITYAASDCLMLGQYKKFVSKYFKYISFREKGSISYNRIENSTYNIDPVFLWDIDFWKSMEKKPEFINDNEVFDFCYMKSKNNESHFTTNKDGIRTYHLYFNNPIQSNKIGYDEFLWLVHNCRKMKTCSFHGFAFSIIFQKKDIEFENNYRIMNLIDILHIKYNGKIIENFDEIQKYIKYEQERALIYLKNCCVFNYACYSKDKDVRDKSTSGGVCAELAKYAIDNNYIVYGGSYNEDFTKVIIKPVDNMDDYFRYLSKSKYNFSFMPKFKDLREKLENGINILYIGSPCQIYMLKKYLNKDYNNLLLVDFKCRGFSKPQRLKEFVQYIKDKYHKDIKHIDFRYNHTVNGIRVTLDDDTVLNYNDTYFKSFVFRNRLNRCENCIYGHGLKSYSDITVSDFWLNSKNKVHIGQDFTPEKGCNHVRTNTLKGFLFFNGIRNNLNIKKLFNGF